MENFKGRILNIVICFVMLFATGSFAEDIKVGMGANIDVESNDLYASLPYTLLRKDETDKSKIYKGSFFAVRVFKVPAYLKIASKNERVLMMTTKKTSERLFLVFPKEKLGFMSTCVRGRKKIDILYKADGIFNKNYPLLRLEKIKM